MDSKSAMEMNSAEVSETTESVATREHHPASTSNSPASQSLKRSTSSALHEPSTSSSHHHLPAKIEKLSTSMRHVSISQASMYESDCSLGTSYRVLASDEPVKKCSGRTKLCHEVLNDSCVLAPRSKPPIIIPPCNQYIGYLFRCEDERSLLAMVMEVNSSTIRELETLYKTVVQMSSRYNPKDFPLDDYLRTMYSPTIYQRAMTRVYGDRAPIIIDGLKKLPLFTIPVVLRRLRTRGNEWETAKKFFDKAWAKIMEKYYLKSLDFNEPNISALESFFEGHEQAETSGMESRTAEAELDEAAQPNDTEQQNQSHQLSRDQPDEADAEEPEPCSSNTSNGPKNQS